jgi:hypothetical protein
MVRGNEPELRRLKSRLEQVYESSSGGTEACLHSEFRDCPFYRCLNKRGAKGPAEQRLGRPAGWPLRLENAYDKPLFAAAREVRVGAVQNEKPGTRARSCVNSEN